jgi:hypothetical protein
MKNQEEIAELVAKAVKTKKWLIRTSDNGFGYNNFKWNEIGEWTEAPDWDPAPRCGGGLHGQTARHSGCLATERRNRVEFCIYVGRDVGIDNMEKGKVRKAMILLVDDLSLADGLSVGGSLDLGGCTSLTALPDGLSVGGSLDLGGCTSLTALPDGLSVGGYLDLPDRLKK